MSDDAAEMEDRHAGQLKELAAMGMDMARSVHAAVMAGQGPADADLRFARIARAVRQSIALEKRLSDEWAEERAIEGEARARHVRELRARTRARLDEIVERAGSDVEIEGAEFTERLADAADDASFLDRPVEEIIAQIRRDLGLTGSKGTGSDCPQSDPVPAAPGPVTRGQERPRAIQSPSAETDAASNPANDDPPSDEVAHIPCARARPPPSWMA
jgi:hypothetical protein